MATDLDALCLNVSIEAGMSNVASSEDRLFLERMANSGVVYVLMETHIFVQIGTVTLTAGVGDYRTDHSMLAIRNKEISGDAGVHTLEQVSFETLLDYRRVSASSPARYFAIQGHDLFSVAGDPTTAETITYFYVPKPSEMSSGSHDWTTATYGGLPSWAQDAVEAYMLWRCARRNDKERGMGVEGALQNLQRECARVRKHQRKMAGRTLSPPRVGYPSGTSLRYGGNDRYPER